ncbi:MAG: hypothetical protein M0T71_12835 [Actinomycetota bacterium]|nr:hypothetical protein [Actinomycetota bacterium]
MKRDDRLAGALGESEDAAKATLGLLRRYVLQETVVPLRHLVKRAALGLVAAVLTGIGFVALLLALLRVLQTETGSALAGTWNFAPYLLTCVAALFVIGVAGLLAFRAVAGRRRAR